MKAFEALMERYQARVFSYILRMVRNHGDAEDLFQDTFFKVIRELSSYEEKGKFRSFLFQIAHNTCLDHLKRAEHRLRDGATDMAEADPMELKSQECAPLIPSQDETLFQQEMKVQLQAAISGLPDNQREVVLLRFYSDLSFKEIAAIVGSPLNTVLGRMHYALKKLKQSVGENGHEGE
ncbi:sigma-70 family RNA polymerase sigma factor [bacterium]|nr:sigma-70 family RNA polymerase sigma factor [candidate division CSSED10-310 bacterium]